MYYIQNQSNAFLFVALIIYLPLVHGQFLATGSVCDDTENGLTGICKPRDLCTTITDGQDISRCGYVNNQVIVCCPKTVRNPSAALMYIDYTSLSARKCREYQKAVHDDTTYRDIHGGINRSNGGDGMLVGGEEARQSEFPHMALIGYNNDSNFEMRCGGSLISESFVLTVAHCLMDHSNGHPTHVKLGLHSVNEGFLHDLYGDQSLSLAVAEVIKHPSYNLIRSRYNDIGLVRLERQVQFHSNMRPSCLPYREQSFGNKALATGWGAASYGGSLHNALNKVELDIFTTEECNSLYSNFDWLKLPQGVSNITQMCAGSRIGQRGICNGDSGGPLQILHPVFPFIHIVLGVSSFGQGCGGEGQPSIFTKVLPFVPWIEDNVWPDVE